jgi:poly(3-hydroxybutyrate) depolymerase
VEIEEPQQGNASGGSGGPVGTWDGRVQVRGQRASDTVDRHFRVYAPRRLNPNRATPVVFNLGGFTVDMYWLAEYTELDRAADLNDFIVVYGQPEWRNFNGTWVFAWYVYENAWNGGWEDNPDVVYLEAVLEQVAGLYNVDRRRVVVSGHSRGAAMSVIAAFERPDLFAGFAAEAGFVSANNYDGRMEALAPSDRFGAWLLHGKQDPDVQVRESTRIASTLETLGWEEGADLVYRKLDGVTHEWQPQYNQDFWDFHAGLALESSP